MTAPTLLLLGPRGHGVTRYGRDVAAAVRALEADTTIVAAGDGADALMLVRDHSRVHVHITDRVLGRSLEHAAAAFERLAVACRLTVTAHDLPQTSDGTGFARRVAAYQRIFGAAAGVVVNSRHEVRLVEEHLPGARSPHPIPLGAMTARASAPDTAPHRGAGDDLVVLIAGYVYPGKGHDAAISAARRAVDDLRAAGEPVGEPVVRAIGGPSAGHDADVDALRAQARALGVRFEITGFLDDAAFAARMLDSGVPLAAHEHVSASRSMLDWVESGRRPLVVDSRYAAEMDELRPGTMVRYPSAGLPGHLATAWREPSRTWLAPGTSLAPSLADVARRYLDWWDRA